MSTVLWAELKNDPEDFASDDLYFLYKAADNLDAQCKALQVTPLIELLDHSDLQFNHSDEDLDEAWLEANAKWLQPEAILPTLRALEKQISNNEDLHQDIEYAIERFEHAEKQGTSVRLLVVM